MFEGQQAGGDAPNMNLNIRPEDMKDCNCMGCGSEIWKEAIMIKIIPALLVGTPKDQVSPFQMIVCDKCGMSLPESLALAEKAEKEEPASKIIT